MSQPLVPGVQHEHGGGLHAQRFQQSFQLLPGGRDQGVVEQHPVGQKQIRQLIGDGEHDLQVGCLGNQPQAGSFQPVGPHLATTLGTVPFAAGVVDSHRLVTVFSRSGDAPAATVIGKAPSAPARHPSAKRELVSHCRHGVADESGEPKGGGLPGPDNRSSFLDSFLRGEIPRDYPGDRLLACLVCLLLRLSRQHPSLWHRQALTTGGREQNFLPKNVTVLRLTAEGSCRVMELRKSVCLQRFELTPRFRSPTR